MVGAVPPSDELVRALKDGAGGSGLAADLQIDGGAIEQQEALILDPQLAEHSAVHRPVSRAKKTAAFFRISRSSSSSAPLRRNWANSNRSSADSAAGPSARWR